MRATPVQMTIRDEENDPDYTDPTLRTVTRRQRQVGGDHSGPAKTRDAEDRPAEMVES